MISLIHAKRHTVKKLDEIIVKLTYRLGLIDIPIQISSSRLIHTIRINIEIRVQGTKRRISTRNHIYQAATIDTLKPLRKT